MATFRSSGVGNASFETIVAFLAALLVVPLLFKIITKVVFGIFKLKLFRKLLFESALIGLTTLLTREDVLDRLFGRPGRLGSGALKPEVDESNR
ncbi:MAG: hypothetical protein R3362_09055 [Rhodothermales bacterium]|nr:hypothetical protein [Rhodothermales bacterium]